MKAVLISALVGTLLATAANAGVMHTGSGLASADVTLSFDEVVLPTGSALTDQYAAFGVTFSGAFYNPQTFDIAPAITGNQIGNFAFPGSPTIVSPWSILFASDVSAAAFGIATNTGSTLVEALLDGTVVGSASATTGASGTDFFQLMGLTFDQIRLSGSPDPGMLVDNLQFSAVPEPGALVLLALGLAGLVVSRRRKQ